MKVLARPIDVSASFLGNGKIKPYRWRTEGDEEEWHVVTVGRVLTTEDDRKAGIKALIFNCTSVINGIERPYALKYRLEEHRWELYKF